MGEFGARTQSFIPVKGVKGQAASICKGFLDDFTAHVVFGETEPGIEMIRLMIAPSWQSSSTGKPVDFPCFPRV